MVGSESKVPVVAGLEQLKVVGCVEDGGRSKFHFIEVLGINELGNP